MKTFQTLSLLAAFSLMLPSCMTTYDRNGRPVQSVDPGVATVGVVSALLVGAALASDNDDHRHHNRHYNRRHYDNRRHHYQPAPCAAPRHPHYRHY